MEINREILKSAIRIKRRKIYQLFLYVLLFVAILFAGGNFIFKLDKLAIKQLYISGNQNIETAKIYELARNELSGFYFGMFQRNNVFIYPKASIENILKRNFLRVSDVSVTGVPGGLGIKIIEREPAYLWCDDGTKQQIDRTCYYLDQNGFAFALAPNFSGDVYLSFFGGEKRGGYMGRSILDSKQFNTVVRVVKALTDVVNEFPSLGRAVGLYVYNNGDFDLLFKRGDSTWKISFNISEDASLNKSSAVALYGKTVEDTLAKKMRAMFGSPFFTSEMERAYNDIEYIDLRFGKKVFYKIHRS